MYSSGINAGVLHILSVPFDIFLLNIVTASTLFSISLPPPHTFQNYVSMVAAKLL